jgi:hypothetical protein
MSKQLVDSLSPLLFFALILALVGTAAYFAKSIFSPSPVDLAAQDAKVIKEWIRSNDLPIGGGRIKAEELPVAYGLVIDHDVQVGDLPSARQFIKEVVQRKLDGQVLALCQQPQAKELIIAMQNGQRKVEGLKQFLAVLQHGDSAEAGRSADEFCQIPFNASASPKQAEEIAVLYRTQLAPQKEKGGPVLQRVIREIEEKCFPRPQPPAK